MELAAREAVESLSLKVSKDSLDLAFGAIFWLTRQCWFRVLDGLDNLRDLEIIFQPNRACDSVGSRICLEGLCSCTLHRAAEPKHIDTSVETQGPATSRNTSVD